MKKSLTESISSDPIFRGLLTDAELSGNTTASKEAKEGSDTGRDRRNNKIKGDTPKESDSYYIKLSDKIIMDESDILSHLKDAESSFKSILTKLNHTHDPNQSIKGIVRCMYLLLLGGVVDYDTLSLSGNINELAYYKDKVMLVFTDQQKVQFKGGPNARRKYVSMTYSKFMSDIKEAVSVTNDLTKE